MLNFLAGMLASSALLISLAWSLSKLGVLSVRHDARMQEYDKRLASLQSQLEEAQGNLLKISMTVEQRMGEAMPMPRHEVFDTMPGMQG